MDIGLCIFATDYAIRIDELARAAEDRGFESLFVPEHTHIPTSRRTPFPGGGELPREYSHTYDPFVVADGRRGGDAPTSRSARASASSSSATPSSPPRRSRASTLLSDGRFLFGIGGGWNAEEMENHGTVYRTRFARLREQVLAMKEIWTKDAAAFHGEHVSFDPIWAWPKPAQKPHPPVLLGGESGYTLQRVVDFCEGWFPRGRAHDGHRLRHGRPPRARRAGRPRHEDDLRVRLRRTSRRGHARGLSGGRRQPRDPAPAFRRPRRGPAPRRPVGEAGPALREVVGTVEGGRQPPSSQYGRPGTCRRPRGRPAALYIFTPPHRPPATPSCSAQLRPRTVSAASGRRKARSRRAPPGSGAARRRNRRGSSPSLAAEQVAAARGARRGSRSGRRAARSGRCSWPMSPQNPSIASSTRPSRRRPRRTCPGARPSFIARSSSSTLRDTRAEERVAAVRVAVDRVARRPRIGDLHEGQLGHRQRRHLDVHQQGGIAVVRAARTSTRAHGLIRGRGHPHQARRRPCRRAWAGRWRSGRAAPRAPAARRAPPRPRAAAR